MKITDRMIYIVVVAHMAGAYLPEQNVADLDRETVVRDIAAGQYEGLTQVIELNPAEHTSRDVTEDICGDVVEAWAAASEPLKPWQYEFVEFARGTAAANAFARAA